MEPGRIIAGGSCGENDCPTVTSAEDGMVDVQGYHLQDALAPDGVAVVPVPAALLIEAARALGR